MSRGNETETIALAAPGDLTQLAPLFDAYRKFFAGSSDPDESERFLGERLARGDSVIFVARAGEAIVGFIQLYPLWSSWYCRRIWFLSDLYVAHSSRKRGIGRRLVARVIAHAGETNASSVMVELPHREPHLGEFYARLGFHKDGIFDLARYLVPNP
ncbi:MAG TPA: GNAT family N-acetyltransferase [Candidatus Nitrosotalea sp.]|nr:GNAT family N-acetyltransferase [Candidatus Nitrosotalea sp.]